jgi:tetratricopeptide (TPR) repeat protein
MAQRLTVRRVGFLLLAGVLLGSALASRVAVAVPLRFEPLFGDRNLLQLLEQRQFTQVRDLARIQLLQNPSDGDMHAVMAYALTELGALADAEQNARQAIDRVPEARRDRLRVLLAEILLRQGRTPEAVQLLNDLLARDSTNTLALLSLGNLYNRLGNAQRAAEYFQEVLVVDPRNDDATRYLLQAYLTQRDYAAVARVARGIPEGSPIKGLGYYFEALSLLQGQPPDNRGALALLERSLEASAPTAQVLTTVGYVLLKEQRAQDAAERLAQAVALAPDSVDALNLLGIASIQLGRPELAVAHLERALADRESVELSHLLSRLYLMQGRVDQGLAELLKSTDDSNQPTEAESALRTLYQFHSGEFEQSEQGLREALARTPEAAHLRFLLIASLLKQDRFEAAAREAEQALTLHPDQSVLVRNLLAMAKLGGGELDAAEEALQTALTQDPASKTTRVNLSTVYFRSGQYASAEREIKAVLANTANDPEATIRLARIYQAAGNYAEAERVLLAANGQGATAGAAARELIMLKLRQRDYGAMLEYALGAVARYPRSFQGYLFQAQALASLGREIDAVDALDAGFEAAGETQGSLAAAASLARLHGWHDLAVGYLQRHDAQFGLDNPTLKKLYATELIEVGRTDDARAVVRDGLGATDPDALLLTAMSHLADGDQVRTEEALDAALAAGVSPAVVEGQRAALRATGQIEALKEQLAAGPADPLRYGALAGAHEIVGDFDAAIAVLEGGLGKAGSDPLFQTHIARLLLKKGDAQRAIEVANGVLANANADAETRIRAHSVVGMSWVFQRDRARAEQALELATVDGSRLAPAFYELARIKSAKGDIEAAKNLLRSAIEIQPTSLQYYLALATLHERSGGVAESIALYEDGISKNERAVPLLNNVALLYLSQGDNERALARARTALEQSPQDANVLDTMGFIHLRSQDTQGAIGYLERAVDYQPAASQYRYHLGLGYFEAGWLDLAKIELEKALDRENNAPWAQEINRLLAAIQER